MDLTGTTQGKQIILDEPLGLPDGTRVRVDVSPIGDERKGSPASVLKLAGTLSEDEASQIESAVRELRRVDPRLWNGTR